MRRDPYTENHNRYSDDEDETGVIAAETEAGAAIAMMRELQLHTVRVEPDEEGGPRVVALPQGLRLESLRKYADEYLERPRRVEGTAHLTTLDSFIEHVTRFADEESAVFAVDDPKHPSLLAVFDYHEGQHEERGVRARFAKHRAAYSFPLSDSWKAWDAIAGSGMSQAAFSEFLEEHIEDVLDPSEAGDSMLGWADKNHVVLTDPAGLMELSRGLAIRVDQKVVQRQNLSSGEGQIVFQEEHSTDEGGPMRIPGGFVIAVPVFRSGDVFQLAVRLRYRIRQGSVTWFLAPARADLVFQTAFNEAVEKVREGTDLPVFYGKPEAAA